ncbi:hypothetical protein [Erythrobacter sp. YT30]|uniref:hypothetical protein n=1 Tax=Erythrobacter sp. YT30 TaxID=1735012 RepID=UPI00076BD444|nr:hypothetical protein [Erythrobacter sp. YT30]KWV93200.1 hypothetical protein AUC45_03515 [Erythrobacter sp. YT30]
MTARARNRRIVAAILLYGFAVGSVLFWREGEFDWVMLGINLGLATLGLALLHLKWRAREPRISADKAKDIFS